MRLVIPLAGCLLLAVLWLLMGFDDSDTETGAANPSSVGDATPELRANGKRTDEPSEDEIVVPSGVERERPTSLTCRLQIRLADRSLDKSQSGTLWLATSHGTLEYQVVNGTWTMPPLPGKYIRSAFFSAMEHAASLPTDLSEIDLENDFVLTGTWLPNTYLHVLDAERGAHLTDVTVIRSLGAAWHTLAYPGSIDPVLRMHEHASSPIRLRLQGSNDVDAQFRVYVSTPAHAWSVVDLDTASGGVRSVRLRPGGTLDVRIKGASPKQRLLVRLTPKGADPNLPPLAQVGTGPTDVKRIDRVPAGTYRVDVVEMDAASRERAVASGEATVVAGETGEIELEIPKIDARDLVVLRGELIVPGTWGRQGEERGARCGMTFTGLDTPDGGFSVRAARGVQASVSNMPRLIESKTEKGVYSFHVPDVRVGTYTVQVSEFGFATKIRIPRGGLTNARILIPDPATVYVRVLDRTSREPIRDLYVSWSRHADFGEYAGHLEGAVADKQTGRHVVMAPAGTIQIQAGWMAYSSPPRVVVISAGESKEITMLAEKTGSVLISLLEGTTPVPFDMDWKIELDEVDGDGCGLHFGGDGSAFRVGVTRPGRYRLRVGPLPGYAKIPDREIVVPAEGAANVTIALTHKK